MTKPMETASHKPIAKWKIPSVLDFEDPVNFFISLIEKNRGIRGFSQRNLSVKMGWPVSYLPDLLNRRKPFTVLQALQLIEYFDFDPLSKEKIILLAVASQLPKYKPDLLSLARSRSSKRSTATTDWQLLDARALLVLEVVRWYRGNASLDRVVALMTKGFLSKTEILDALEFLQRKKVIVVEAGRYRAIVNELHSDDDNPVDDSFHRDCALFFIRFLESSLRPALYNSASIHLPISNFEEYADRIVALRNWLFAQSRATIANQEAHDSVVFQLDLNLYPTFAPDHL